MKILELFSGYGTATFALKRLGIEHEVVGYSDIDKYANQCFQQNHGGKELGDVKLIKPNDLEDFDLLTGGFPCQAFSNAGKMKGELEPRGTLFYEIIRIAEVKKPKFMLLENVKGLTCKKFKDTFSKILSELDRIGYNVYWKVLNSKDFGIPQSRARVWFVCFRKDIDTKTFTFPEPVELKLKIKDLLEDNVDEKYYLSEKLQQRFMNYIIEKNKKLGVSEPCILDTYNHKIKEDGTCITILEPHHNNMRLIEGTEVINLQPRQGKGIGGKGIISKNDGTTYCLDRQNTQGILVYDNATKKYTTEVYEVNEENDLSRPSYLQLQNGNHSEAHRVYNSDGIIQTIKKVPLKILEKEHLKIEGYLGDRFGSCKVVLSKDSISPTLSASMGLGGGYVPKILDNAQISNCEPREAGFKDICPTLKARDYKDPKVVRYLEVDKDIANCIKVGGIPSKPEHYFEKKHSNFTGTIGRIRKLTPKECFRLMGFLNDEINLDGLSDTQRYKLAGNGQDVNMVSLIFKEMFK